MNENKPMKMLPQVRITRAWNIRISHHLQTMQTQMWYENLATYNEAILDKIYKFLGARNYESVSSPQVVSAYVDSRFSHNERRHELMAIRDLLVGIVSYIQLHTRCETVNNFSHNSSYGEGVEARHYYFSIDWWMCTSGMGFYNERKHGLVMRFLGICRCKSCTCQYADEENIFETTLLL